MKKIVLSAVVAIALGSTVANASTMKFYSDENGQVFVTPGKGRTELKANPQEVMQAIQSASEVQTTTIVEKEEIKEEIKAELKEEMKKDTPVFAKADKLKFSGKVYTGFNYKDMNGGTKADGTHVDGKDAGSFELRRNYVQVKAYLLEDPKSYFRVTLDATYTNKTASNDGHADVYVKYAYLFLNDILPSTGVEFGMVHRPWIDYEEHQGWWMRSISKVFMEAGEAGHLSNSADLGFNFKTKTEYFTSEVGLFNGEGYHGTNDSDEQHLGDGISAEWRLTGAFLGNGKTKRKPLKDSYFDASFFGQYNMKNSHNESDIDGKSKNYRFLGLHTVYNMPSFLVAAQYIDSSNDLDDSIEWNGKGYSVNGTYRIGENKEFSVIARYDYWDNINSTTKKTEYKENNYIYGVAWNQNKNVKWLLSGQTYNRKNDTENLKTKDWTSGMITAEVHW